MTRARLAHGWVLYWERPGDTHLVEEFVRPALRAVPETMAAQIGYCEVRLGIAEPEVASRWTETPEGIEIEVGIEGVEAHDLAMEVLTCLGQALWETAETTQRKSYLGLLRSELGAGVEGEIDEGALDEKRQLLSSPVLASSRRQLVRYARASFSETAAEYVHCLWHEVTVRTGSEHLPAEWLRRRLELFTSWYPPDRGYRLFG